MPGPDGRIGAGPVRLIGLPRDLRSSSGSLVAVSGNILNLGAIQSQLGAVDPDGDQQTSLVLRAFLQWGLEAPARLRGDFALAFWDAGSQRLVLAGDPLGLRTVFHTSIDDVFVFSASLRALLALPGLRRDLDEAYVAAFLADVVPEANATPYAAIRRVPAACTLTFDHGGAATVRSYWSPDWGRRIRHRHDDTYVEEARVLLDQAVRRQLPGAGPVMCQLSGGFDSGAVAATAARLRAPSIVHAITTAPPDGVSRYEHPSLFGDERPAAAAVARMHPNMAWEAVSSPDLHAVDKDPLRLFLPLGMPVRNVLNIGWFAPSMERARALGSDTVLGGFFGNMTLSWDGLCGLASMARRGRWLRLRREVAALGQTRGLSVTTVLRRYLARPLLPPRMQRWLDDRRGIHAASGERHSAIQPDFARTHGLRERRLEFGHGYLGDTETMRRRWLQRIQTLPPLSASLSEVFGVQLRDPTADLDLLEFCFAVPDEQYLRNGTTRWLARRVLSDRLPPVVLNETRRGLQCPEFLHRMTLQRDAIVEGVEALERSPLACRVLDVARMKRLAGNWPTDAATTTFGEYGAVLRRGLHVGQFLRWLETGSR